MAETDRFLCEALAQSECLPASAQGVEVKDLSSEAFVSIVWRCLAKIQQAEPHLELLVPEDVDAHGSVAARHRVGSQLAIILKELGYAGDCGYNHFLYPNEKESRSILSWLVGKVPRGETDGKAASESASNERPAGAIAHPADYLADKPLADIFSAWMKKKTLYVFPNREVPGLRGFEKLPLRTSRVELPWIEGRSSSSENQRSNSKSVHADVSRAASMLEALAVAQRRQAINIDSFDNMDENTEASSAFGGRIENDPVRVEVDTSGANPMTVGLMEDSESPIANAPPVIPPFFVSAAAALKENAMTPLATTEMDTKQHIDDGNAHKKSSPSEHTALKEDADQASLEVIHIQLMETQQHIDQLRDELDQDQDKLTTIQVHIERAKSQGVALKKELATKRQLLGLLPQAEANVTKLEAICAKNELKLKELASEWETHKRPLAAEEQSLLSMKSNRKARCRQFVAEMKVFRAEMKEMATTIQEKMDALRVLDKTYATMPQNINRNSYTNRIMDIIKQVHKQKQEIGRIIEDIKSIQKQLNFSSEKLKRSEAVTEEKLFGEASKQVNNSKNADNPYIECYRKFAQVRELFEELILVVGDVGKKENAARDLENWITQLQGRDSSEQLDRVLADLHSIRQENAALNEQLRALREAH